MQKFTSQEELITHHSACMKSQTNPENQLCFLCIFFSPHVFFLPPLLSSFIWIVWCLSPDFKCVLGLASFQHETSLVFSALPPGAELPLKLRSAFPEVTFSSSSSILIFREASCGSITQGLIISFNDTIRGEGKSMKLSEVQHVTVH